MRYALIDTWTGQRVLFSETDVKTMQEVLRRATCDNLKISNG